MGKTPFQGIMQKGLYKKATRLHMRAVLTMAHTPLTPAPRAGPPCDDYAGNEILLGGSGNLTESEALMLFNEVDTKVCRLNLFPSKPT